MKASIDTLKITSVLTAPVAVDQLVGFTDAPTGANGAVKGVACMAGVTGDAIALTSLGLRDLVAGAAIAAGDELISNAAGLPVPKGATENPNVFARAINAAVNGGRVTVLIR